MRKHVGACRTHEVGGGGGGGGGGGVQAQDLARRDREIVPHPAPTRGSNPGPSDLNSDSLTTELRPPVQA